MYCQTVVHTRNWYPSSNRLVFKENACKVGVLNTSSVFSPLRRKHLSEERVSVLMICSLTVAQFGQFLIRSIIQNVDIHPSFSFPTATTQSLYICKCRWTCSSAGQGKKRTGIFPAVQKQPVVQHLTLCIQRWSSSFPPAQPIPSLGFSPSSSDSKTSHISSVSHCPAEGYRDMVWV